MAGDFTVNPPPYRARLKDVGLYGHTVSAASDGSVTCRACGGLMARTGMFLEKGGYMIPPQSEIVVCGGCGWAWWLTPYKKGPRTNGKAIL